MSPLSTHLLPPQQPPPLLTNTSFKALWSSPSRLFVANGRTRLWFRRSLRLFGLDPGTVAHKFSSFRQPLSKDDVEQLKKMFVPLSSFASLIFLFLGPVLFPALYSPLCFLFFSFIVLVNYSHFVRYIIAFLKMRKIALEWAKNPNPKVQFKHLHTIIIPNYQEPISLLRTTLTQLAQHQSSKTHYVIVLAMEAAEGSEAEQKSQRLASDFKGAFHSILTTMHPAGIPGECRGKGSNVAWAVQQTDLHLQNELRTIDPHRVILTIVDADAGISELYFNELEREMACNPTHDAVPLVDPQYRLFCPMIFFARNSHQVPAIVRATDVAWSIAYMQNLGSPKGLHFPCSSYSVTLSLARHVGGWDTSADAIGEDMHMFLKCFYLSHGLARSTPIFVPVNLSNVQASTYTGSITAKFTQVRRHFAGSADSLYALRHAFWPHHMDLPSPIPTRMHPAGHLVVPRNYQSQRRDVTNSDQVEGGNPIINYRSYFWDRIMCMLHVFEAHLVPSTSWITILALPLTSILNPTLAASWSFAMYIKTLSLIMIVPYIIMGFMYEFSHRFLTQSQLLGPYTQTKETRSWYHVFDYILLPICVVLYVAMPATSHCDNALRILVLRQHAQQFTYIVAEKGLVDQCDPKPIPYVPMRNVPLPSLILASSSSDRNLDAASPAVSDVDSGIGTNDSMQSDELTEIVIESSAMCPSILLSIQPNEFSIPPLQLPPSISTTTTKRPPPLPPSPLISKVSDPPSPVFSTSHTLQIVAANSWLQHTARLDPTLKRPGHAKHLSTDSGFYEMDVSSSSSSSGTPIQHKLDLKQHQVQQGRWSPMTVTKKMDTPILGCTDNVYGWLDL